jgi:hypothetical protein
MQTDGNFVLSDSHGKAVWDSRTSGKDGAFMTMQDDGYLVIANPVWRRGKGQ